MNDLLFLLEIETPKTIQLPLQSISDKIINNEDILDDIDSSTLVTVSGK